MGKLFGWENPFRDFFGAKRPLDDPFSPSLFDNSSGSRKQIKTEEMNPGNDAGRNDFPSKELSVENSKNYPTTGVQNFSFQRVEYGGPDGMYYSSSVSKRSVEDGVFIMEIDEGERTVGESLNTVSKGIYEKGHSVAKKQHSDGGVGFVRTSRNLEEGVQRVEYGGPDGMYYSSSVRKRSVEDGVFMMEIDEEERTVGESPHTISKGIYEKGHSVVKKQRSDGGVGFVQTSRNLEGGSNSNTQDDFAQPHRVGTPFPSLDYGAQPHQGGWPFPSLDYGAQPHRVGTPFPSLDYGAQPHRGGWPFPSLDYGAQPHRGGTSFPSLEYYGELPVDEPQEPPSRKASSKIVPIDK